MISALYRVFPVDQTEQVSVIYIGEEGIAGRNAEGKILSGRIFLKDEKFRSWLALESEVTLEPTAGHVEKREVKKFELPLNFVDGNPVDFPINGDLVKVVFVKIIDIPIPPTSSYHDLSPAESIGGLFEY